MNVLRHFIHKHIGVLVATVVLCVPGPSLNAQEDLTISLSGPRLFDLWWHRVEPRTYYVQYTTDLVAWSFLPAEVGWDWEWYGLQVQTDEPKMFFRLKYTEQPYQEDFDGDFVSNYAEVSAG